MIPKRVTLENFLSYGPKTEIAFAADEPLWVVGGPNGVGKSAVFDAMTYCLYAEHRGGGQGHDDLIRHGADRFSVSFEFEFAGRDYRITRTRPRKGRTTQAVEHQAGGSWKRVPDVDSAKEVDAWVVRTVGLSFDAFCASVLLRQGHADDILDATPAKRLDTLKKIIGVERYEELSGRVNEARKAKEGSLKHLQEQRKGVREEELSDDAVAEAVAAVETAAAAREQADAARTRAVAAVPLADQWAKLNTQAADLDRKLAEADDRRRGEADIRRAHARFTELSAVVPVLQQLVPLRAKVTEAENGHAAASARRDELRAELENGRRRAEGLRLTVSQRRQEASDLSSELTAATAERDRRSHALSFADELAAVGREAGAFPVTLDDDTAAARESLRAATDAERTARDDEAETSGRVKDARKQQQAFADVKAGIPCSQCGQEVTAEHAERERRGLVERVTTLTAEATDAKAKAVEATAARGEADARLNKLTAAAAERSRLHQRRADLGRSLAALGGPTDPVAVRAEIERLGRRVTDLQTRHAAARTRQEEAERELTELEPTVQRQETDLQWVEADLTKLGTDLARGTATRDALLTRLPGEWGVATDAGTPAAELRTLAAAGIEHRFKALEQDAALRREWEEQREALAREMADVAADARIPVDAAKANQQAAERGFGESDAAHRAAVARHAELTRRREQLAALVAAVAAAETDARVHAKLDKLLGKGGLQRELIRESESAIVRLTQQTLANLSAGDLSVALADADGDDKAFDLLVFRGGDTNPIPVKMLSGSQKFRVAVSVALAVGRFATGQARPLECVIIDEGFGSLDQDGLRAAADELNRLKDHLKRIILVSHQEEFTDRFPVVIRLSQGEKGTEAVALRR